MHRSTILSRRVAEAGSALAPLIRFITESPYATRQGDPTICDFTFGNPHDPTPAAFLEALRAHIGPLPPTAYAYTQSEPSARAVVAEALARESGLPFEPEDVLMTTGAFGAIAVAFAALLDPGDEVVYALPPWFCYEPMLRHVGGVPVKVPLAPPRFELDVDAFERALTPRTRLVIVNTPHNPTGRVFGAGELGRLGACLERASARFGRPIMLLSDEPYRRLRFAGRAFEFPARHYAATVMSYSWGKILLTPGARLGYLAIAPHAPEREALRSAFQTVAITGGWLFPNALLQRAVPDLMETTIDLAALDRKRARMVTALRDIGYELADPEGTFYLLPKAPGGDDVAYAERLARDDVFVLPGTVCELPGYFRVCITATEAMIERALPVFAAAFRELRDG
jgi:aspartate aminotransferase